MALFSSLTSRTIQRCFGIYKEVLFESRFGIFLPQSPESTHLVMWNKLTTVTLAELLQTRCSFPTSASSLNTWRGIMSSVLSIIRFRKEELLDSAVNLTFFTNDLALFGRKLNRNHTEESIAAFLTLLEEVRLVTSIRINCVILCVKISNNSLDSHIHTANVIFKSISGNSDKFGKTKIYQIENSSIHYEAELRFLIQNSKSMMKSVINFPSTSSFKGSVNLELLPATFKSFTSEGQRLSSLQLISIVSKDHIDPITLDGEALLARPDTQLIGLRLFLILRLLLNIILTYFIRSRSNKLFFLAFQNILREKNALGLLKSSRMLPFKRPRDDYNPDNSNLHYNEFWLAIPKSEGEVLKCCEMTILKLSGR